LEEEAEEADKTLREANEKYVNSSDDAHTDQIIRQLTLNFQAPPNRRQSWPLRAQGPSSRARTRSVGAEV